MKKKLIGIAAATAVVVVWAGTILAQEFLPYEGKNTIQEGEGGTKKVVDGVDFWADGAPPRPFKLLGYISDRRHKTGLIGMIRMSGLESDVAKLAKENGGDAVILVSSEAETVGTVGSGYGQAQGTANTAGGNTVMHGSGWSTGTSAAVQKQQSKYAVVKYVEQKAPAASEPAPSPSEVRSSPDAGSSASSTPTVPATK
jgi:hypothetical protein